MNDARSQILVVGAFGGRFHQVPDGHGCDSIARILPSRFTGRKIAPPLMPAAGVHSSKARFVHTGCTVGFQLRGQLADDV